MRLPIVLSCLWIAGCAAADNTPAPHKYDDFAPAADLGTPSEDASSAPVDGAEKAEVGAPTVDSSMTPEDTSVAKDSAVADTHAVEDTHTAKDSFVAADTYTPPEDTGAAIDSAPLPEDTGSAAVDTGTAKPDSGSVAPTLVTHEITFYGWPDNDPPGPAIAYPKVHPSAGGVGTYEDPITFATATAEFPKGTILYVPYIKKYVIMEDLCAACTSDWSSGKRHIDIWMNSNASNTAKLKNCQYAWTRPSEQVEIHPPPDREVTTAPLFDTSTAICRTTP